MLGYYLQFRSLYLEVHHGGIHPTTNGSSLQLIFFLLVHQFVFTFAYSYLLFLFLFFFA